MSRAHSSSLIGAIVVCVALAFAPAAMAFGVSAQVSFEEAGGAPLAAGGHPFAMTTGVEFTVTPAAEGGVLPDEEARDVKVQLPPGFIGNPDAVPTCPNAAFADISAKASKRFSACPADSVVGQAEIAAGFGSTESIQGAFESNRKTGLSPAPVFNLERPPGVASKLGFIVVEVPVTVEVKIEPEPPYNLIAEVSNISDVVQVYGSRLALWGVPAAESHDGDRGNCSVSEALCPVSGPEIPFLTLPASCHPLLTSFEADSWQNPGVWTNPLLVEADDGGEPPAPVQPGDCEGLEFHPNVHAEPTSHSAGSASGLDFEIEMPNEGLLDPSGRSEATIEKAVVKMPPGVSANPSAAAGLTGCSPSELHRETLDSAPGEGCPQSSKIGSVEIESPILKDRQVTGDVFLATPHENPFGSLLATYVVVREPQLGILLRIAGEIETDPQTGQLTTVFGGPSWPLPQLPFSHFRFHLRGGPRAPLALPSGCGNYEGSVELTPSSGGPTVLSNPTFSVDSGAGGSACPSTPAPFKPGFEAGSTDNKAGAYSPLSLRISRGDAEPDITRLGATLPRGVVARIAGVPRCPASAILAAKLNSGLAEMSSPSCPAGSEIGHLIVGAGTGDALTYVSGRLYLGGPMNGDPLSIIAVTPAVTGPFDLGTVVTREALTLDPSTGQAVVDPAASDPLPQIIEGIPVHLRELRAYVDRPNFATTPTGCDVRSAVGAISGGLLGSGDVFGPAHPSQRYQAAGCAALGFHPHLKLLLKGGTRRGQHPALKAVLRTNQGVGSGETNIKQAVVRLPHSAFLEQAHIRTICTRVQFAAAACPKGSVYGRAKAWTPLLDEPLAGPVYLRSSNNALPDLVAALKGPESTPVEIDLAGRIDAIHGGIRTSFESIPDAPVSRFVLEMQGGNKGLIVNSRDLCRAGSRAEVKFGGQNGKSLGERTPMRAGCGHHKHGRSRGHKRGR